MPRLIWTPPALRDVARLHAFLMSQNPDAARRAVRAIRQRIRTLAAHPEIGHSAEDLPSELRLWFIPFGNSGYVVLYRFEDDVVTILSVRHARQAGF